MTSLYFIRHGKYETHDDILPYRLSGFHLSQKGIEDVEVISKRISSKNIVAVYTSPLERTFETALILSKPFGLTPIVDERLLETRSPVEGKTTAFLHEMGDWKIFDSNWYKDNGGESIEEIALRMKSFINDVAKKYDGKEVVIVSHGDPLMITMGFYKGVQLVPDALSQLPYIPMAGGFKLEISENGVLNVAPLLSHSI